MKTLEQQLCDLIVKKLGLDGIDPDTIKHDAPLFSAYDDEGEGLELDSVDSLELVVGLREYFGVVVGDKDMSAFQNVNALASYIRVYKAKAEAAATNG